MAVHYTKMTIITRRDKFPVLTNALLDLNIEGMTATEVTGNGTENGQIQYVGSDGRVAILLIPKIYVELVTTASKVSLILKTILPLLQTGIVGDGKIFLENIEGEIYRISSGEKAGEDEEFNEESEEFVMSAAAKPMTKITIITRKEKMKELRKELVAIGVSGMTVTNVEGCGRQHGVTKFVEGISRHTGLLPKIKVEIVVCSVPVQDVIDTAQKVLGTGSMGDGKIFTSPIAHAIRVRTGETDDAAI